MRRQFLFISNNKETTKSRLKVFRNYLKKVVFIKFLNKQTNKQKGLLCIKNTK